MQARMTDRSYRFRLRFLLQELDLGKGTFVIGRSPSCNLTIKDPLVSRRHARITVGVDFAIIDDLGSRNGTLVNDEPVFDNRRLWHSDTIRIGAHTLGFVREKEFQTSKPIFLDRDSRPGGDLELDDSTVPVELGGDRSGWTPEIIDGVIGKAIDVGRLDKARNLLDGRMVDYERMARRGEADMEELVTLSGFNLDLAAREKDPRRISWVVDIWTVTPQAMPDEIVKELEKVARGWYDIESDLSRYLESIESRDGDLEIDSDQLERLRIVIDGMK